MDYLILLSTIAAGALTVLKFRLEERSYVRLFNSFTGGYLLCLTFLHLLPELYAHHGHDHGEHAAESSAHLVGALILVGFFVQVILDSISMGVEHGHSLGEHVGHEHHHHGPGDHGHEHHHHGPGQVRAGVPIGVVTGLCLHAFVEAMALGDAATHHDPASRQMLLASIVIHNYPVSIVMLVMLLHAGVTRAKALGFLGLFAAMAPLGMALSQFTELAHHTRELTAMVIGIFMHIATTILFESSDSHRFNLQKVIAIVAGVGLGVLTVMMHSHGSP